MVRPKLVQEGASIYDDDGLSNNDQSMDDAGASPSSSTTASIVASLKSAATTKDKNQLNLQNLSSLQKAAAIEGAHPNYYMRNKASKSSTSYVIGGGRSSTATTASAKQAHISYSSHPAILDNYRQSSHQQHASQHYQVKSSYQIPAAASAGNGDDELMIEDDDGNNHHPTPTRQQHHYIQPPPHPPHHYQQQQEEQQLHQYQIGNHGLHYIPNNGRHPTQNTSCRPSNSIQPGTQTTYKIGTMSTTTTTSEELPPPYTHSHAEHYEPPTKMEGVEDLSLKQPLVVLDGANVAYAYANVMEGMASSLQQQSSHSSKPEPDPVGIKVATDYFQQSGLRVLVVLPQYWLTKKPRQGDHISSSLMITPQLEVLQELKSLGLIVSSPPTDDDDAYALTISRREESRSLQRQQGLGPGFVLSNDMFRDAQQRDSTLKDWLNKGRNSDIGPGRISYTFCDMGTMNDHGERILDFIPNPRHPLIVYTESILHSH